MNNELRKQFEALPDISKSLQDGDIYWDDKKCGYIATDIEFYYDVGYANGAWFAFQEQQKRIDEAKTILDKIYKETEGDDELLLKYLGEILELLK